MAFSRYAHGRHQTASSQSAPSTSTDELMLTNTSGHLLSVKHERRMGKIKSKWVPQRLSFSNNTIPSLNKQERAEIDLHLNNFPVVVEERDSNEKLSKESSEQGTVDSSKSQRGEEEQSVNSKKSDKDEGENGGGGSESKNDVEEQPMDMTLVETGKSAEVMSNFELHIEEPEARAMPEREGGEIKKSEPLDKNKESQPETQSNREKVDSESQARANKQFPGIEEKRNENLKDSRTMKDQGVKPKLLVPKKPAYQVARNDQRPTLDSRPQPKPQIPQMESNKPKLTAMKPFEAMGAQRLSVNGKEYCLLKEIGRGGSSLVYEALDAAKNLFAIKVVDLSKVDAVESEAFKNEVVLLQKLQALRLKRVIKMYDYEIIRRERSAQSCYYDEDEDEFEEEMLVVMERGDVNLASLLKKKVKEGGVSDLERQFYWAEMLQAVQEIHNEGVIHSDLKPANFLIVHGTLKLIDFGIASAVNPDKTSVEKSSIMGTINFMAPEAISNIARTNNEASKYKISVKSDVWSLGCILYFLTFYRLPFDDLKHPLQKVQAIMNDKHPIPMPKTNNALLGDVIAKCLVREPKARASVPQLLQHPYLDQKSNVDTTESNKLDSKHLLSKLDSVLTPNSKLVLSRALNKLQDTNPELR